MIQDLFRHRYRPREAPGRSGTETGEKAPLRGVIATLECNESELAAQVPPASTLRALCPIRRAPLHPLSASRINHSRFVRLSASLKAPCVHNISALHVLKPHGLAGIDERLGLVHGFDGRRPITHVGHNAGHANAHHQGVPLLLDDVRQRHSTCENGSSIGRRTRASGYFRGRERADPGGDPAGDSVSRKSGDFDAHNYYCSWNKRGR